MKITSVELHPAGSSNVAVLSFRDPSRQNPLNVKSISGLDADEIVPRYYGSSAGVSFYNFVIAKRDVVVRIGLNPDFSELTYSALRDQLYRLISSSRTGLVQIQFKNGNAVIAAVSGLITKFGSDLFAKDPDVEITFRCDDPMLRAIDPVVVPVAGLDPAATIITDNLSTAPHGVVMEFTFNDVASDFYLSDIGDNDWSFYLRPPNGFFPGDILKISSENDNKYVYQHRYSTDVPIADTIRPRSLWPIIFPGETTFQVEAPVVGAWTRIEHRPAYWGV